MPHVFQTVNKKATTEKVRKAAKRKPKVQAEALALLDAGKVRDAARAAGVQPVYHPRFRYQFIDYRGRKRTRTGTTSQRDTERQAERRRAFEHEIRDGVRPAPRPWDTPRDYASTVQAYLGWGAAHGGRRGFAWAAEHYKNRRRYLAWWGERLNLRTVQDIDLPTVEKGCQELQSEKAGRTVAAYAEAIAAFCNWCVTRQYLAADPLAALGAFHCAPGEPHRALTDDEVGKLLAVAPAERSLWYRVALQTGYRQKELRALKVRNLDLFGPSLPLAAEYCKDRRDARQPITRALADELARLASGKDQDAPLLDMPPKNATTTALNADFAAAAIRRETPDGLATFHSFRVNYINAVVKSGADLKTIMTLARHSSATMSMSTYAKPDANRLRQAAEDAASNLLNVIARTSMAQRKVAVAAGERITAEDEQLCVVSGRSTASCSNPSPETNLGCCNPGSLSGVTASPSAPATFRATRVQ